MKWLLDRTMATRAHRLAGRIQPFLPAGQFGLDLGAGTGHNAAALRRCTSLRWVEIDVVKMTVVGPGPVLFSGRELPFASQSFAVTLLSFVLAYAAEPVTLLREIGRVTAGPVLIVQSTYQGRAGYLSLRLNELSWGPIAFNLARLVNFIDQAPFPLRVQRLFTRAECLALFDEAGFSVRNLISELRLLPRVKTDLFVLEHQTYAV